MAVRYSHICNYIILAITFFTLHSCTPEDAPQNPCANAQFVSADFLIEELVGKRYFLGDTVNGMNMVRFTALQDADEYTWTLGGETIKTKSFSRRNFPDGWIDVKLVLKRKPNLLCFPKDDGIDSSSRRFYSWPWYSNVNMQLVGPYFPIYGTYHGHYTNNPSFEFNVSLLDTAWVNGDNKPWFVGIIRGLPKSYFNSDFDRNASIGDLFAAASPKAMQIQYGGANGHFNIPPVNYIIPRMFGYAWLERSDPKRINIQYVFQDTITNTTYSDTLFFIGTKIY